MKLEDQIKSMLGGSISQPLAQSSNPLEQQISSILQGNQSTGLPSMSGDYTGLIHKYFPQSEWDRAEKVMQAESGGDPNAIGDNYPIAGQTIPSYGLFQIRSLPGRPDKRVLMNPEENVKYAAQMQAAQGWQPWTTAVKMGFANIKGGD